MLQHAPPSFFFQSWPLLLELQLPFIKDRPGARASLDGQTGVLGSVPKSPHVQGAMGWGWGWCWGCWLTTPSSHEHEGSLAKMDSRRKEREFLWLLGAWWARHCSCKRSQRNGTVSHSGFIWEKGCKWNWITWSCVQVAQEEKCGSWVRHTCLYEAVCGSTAYLLRARSHYFTYSAHDAAPTSVFLHPPLPVPFLLIDDPHCPALTRLTMQACYSSRLQIGRVLPLVPLLQNVKGELTVARCIRQLSADGRIGFLRIQNLERP